MSRPLAWTRAYKQNCNLDFDSTLELTNQIKRLTNFSFSDWSISSYWNFACRIGSWLAKQQIFPELKQRLSVAFIVLRFKLLGISQWGSICSKAKTLKNLVASRFYREYSHISLHWTTWELKKCHCHFCRNFSLCCNATSPQLASCSCWDSFCIQVVTMH